MAAKIFEVNDVLPATTQLRISWEIYYGFSDSSFLKSDNDTFEWFQAKGSIETLVLNLQTLDMGATYENGYTLIWNYDGNYFIEPYNTTVHNYLTIDTSSWSLDKRTISTYYSYGNFDLYWEDLNAPSGYTISFNSNGGTSISDIEEATELPTPLPTPTRSGYTFVNWYYDSAFTQIANAGDTIESNVTLYAKWHNLGSLFTEIADAIRSKDGTSGNIRDVDFGERVKQIQGAKEEETKTVTPNFASGNVVVSPTSGKVLSQVTINKDSNLIADNIKSGVTIFGITGTYEGEVTPSGFNVTITVLSNSYNALTFYDCADFDDWGDPSPTATLLGTLQPGQSDTYFVESGYICITGISIELSNFVNCEVIYGYSNRVIKILGDNASFSVVDMD